MNGNRSRSTRTPGSPEFDYVANGGDHTIPQFSVGTNGELKRLMPFTVAAGSFPATLLVDPQGKYLFAKNANDGTITTVGLQFSVGQFCRRGSARESRA